MGRWSTPPIQQLLSINAPAASPLPSRAESRDLWFVLIEKRSPAEIDHGAFACPRKWNRRSLNLTG